MEERCFDLVNDSTKTTLSSALRNVLNSSEYNRRAEDLIKALEVIEQYGMYLADYIVNPDEKTDVRLLSVVLLKQYVETHWSKRSDKFRRPETSRTAKEYIKNILPRTFGDPSLNLRRNVARVISAIALFEYPDHWPDFFSRMIEMIKQNDERHSHGALQILLEYVSNNNDLKISFILDLIPHLLVIIINTNHLYSIRTRSRCVKIVKLLLPEIKKFILKNSKCKSMLEDYVRSFLHAFLEILHTAHTFDVYHHELKNNIIQAVEVLVVQFSHIVQPYFIQQFLPLIWQFLVKASNEYKNQTSPDQHYFDEEGDIINIDSQIITIFDFIRTICLQNGEISNNIYGVLTDLIFHTIVCMQITPIIMADWNKNCENFISENYNNIDYKVRHAAYNLLNEIMTVLNKKKVVSAFCGALCRHICHAEAQRKMNERDWWQGLEASMCALGSVRSYIIAEHSQIPLEDFNLIGYLNTAAQYTQVNDIPVLLGRCIWLCGMFCKIMNRDTLQIVVESTVKHLQYNSSIVVRVYALRALKKYCEPTMLQRTQSILTNHLNGILNCLCNTVDQFGASMLRLTLEAMSSFVKVNESFTAASIELIVPFAISIFLKYNEDPLITLLMMNLIRSLVQIPNVLPQLQQIFAPTILSVLNTPVNVATSGIHIVALEILGVIVRNQRDPLNERFLETLFPAAVNVILHSTDFHILQAGGECISNFLFSGAAQQVCVYRNSEGQLGIDFIIEIINKLLDPYGHEYNAKFISLLIIILIVKAGEHLFVRLEPLLRAILSKMQCTESDCNMQCLISIFAYLVHTQTDAIINFLNTIPGPNGEAALEFVLMEWVFTHSTVTSEFEYKIGIVALIQIFEYGISNENYVLQTMAINENEHLEKVENTTCRWVPILAKILKVLLCSFQLDEENTSTQRITTAESKKQNNDNVVLECDEQDDIYNSSSDAASLDEEMDSSIIALLPMLKHLNVNDHICSFFLTYKGNEIFHSFFRYFDDNECRKLLRMGIDVATILVPYNQPKVI